MFPVSVVTHGVQQLVVEAAVARVQTASPVALLRRLVTHMAYVCVCVCVTVMDSHRHTHLTVWFCIKLLNCACLIVIQNHHSEQTHTHTHSFRYIRLLCILAALMLIWEISLCS